MNKYEVIATIEAKSLLDIMRHLNDNVDLNVKSVSVVRLNEECTRKTSDLEE